MMAILSAIVSIFAFRFRSRASLEFKLVALQHQLAVLRRQRPGRPQLSSLDRLLGLPPPLALAITPAGTTHDRHRNPCFDPPYEKGQPVHGEFVNFHKNGEVREVYVVDAAAVRSL